MVGGPFAAAASGPAEAAEVLIVPALDDCYCCILCRPHRASARPARVC